MELVQNWIRFRRIQYSDMDIPKHLTEEHDLGMGWVKPTVAHATMVAVKMIFYHSSRHFVYNYEI